MNLKIKWPETILGPVQSFLNKKKNSIGQTLITSYNRMRLRGHSLEINGITEEDNGQYICEVETFGSPLNQPHTLEVLGKKYVY